MIKKDFNSGWLFSKRGSDISAVTVDLPHDAMIHEQRSKDSVPAGACGYFREGCYEYVKKFSAPGEWENKSVILELEGEDGFEHLEEYADGSTERGKKLRTDICERFHFSSLEFQTLDNVIEAIGLPECELCTYCWNGKE